jgi:multicomponent Na+:H+ antiporter subunit C
MTHPELFALVGAGVIAIGLHGLVVRPHVLRRLIAVNVIGAGVFLILVALAARPEGSGPDPVPHAMVLTGIVIAVSFTAFAAVLAVRLDRARGPAEGSDEEEGPRR